MTIPESQFDTWSKQGATTNAQNAHHSIRGALKLWTNWTQGVAYDDYLQGSYRNSTNTWRDSDVDLVIELTSTIRCDTSRLSSRELQQFNSSSNWASYDWVDFRAEVLHALHGYFGASRIDSTGKKSIKVSRFNGLTADVVVAMRHITYLRYPGTTDNDRIEGITFLVPAENRWVVNYPRQHIANGEQKNRGNVWYKPTVRIFKNMNRYMLDKRFLVEGVAPSYFLECLLYNVPDSKFGTSYQNTFNAILEWIRNSNFDNLMCQNGQVKLIGTSPEQWSSDKAFVYLKAAIDLAKNWNT